MNKIAMAKPKKYSRFAAFHNRYW